MRKLVFTLLLVLMPLGLSACQNRALAPDVTEAQAKLHEAEGYFAKAQAAIIQLARAGILKGATLANAKKAEATAYSAIQAARTAVDSKNASALKIAADALVAVLQLVAVYTQPLVK